MKWSELFTSSIGKKWVMAASGLCLIAFLLVHVTLNTLIWANIFVPEDNGEIFNRAAHWLGNNLVPRVLEVGLFLFFIIHIIQGYALEAKNRTRRGKAYKVTMGSEGSPWYRRSMGLLGTLIFIFLVVHISNFWISSRFGGLKEITYPDGNTFHNLYGEMVTVFQEPWIVVLYVLGCVSLAWHLIHGFQSAFRTIGVSNKRYLALLNTVGIGFSLLVSILFAAMPISIYLGYVK